MFIISKKFHFSASHQLHGLPAGHPCGRLHGHNYEIEIVLGSDVLDERGFVMDYGDLQPFRDVLDRLVEHVHLNEALSFQPSAENLARHFFDLCQDFAWPVLAVKIKETPKTCATYAPTPLLALLAAHL